MSPAPRSPDDERLSATLGRAKKYWDDFLARIRASHPDATLEWKHYSTGWRLLVKDRRRNLAYLNPLEQRFLVSFAFNDEAVDAAEQSDLPAAIVDPIRGSKKFPEGRAVRIEVSSACDVGHAATLFAIQFASRRPKPRSSK